MLSELQKIIQTDNLSCKTIAKWSPMLLKAETDSKLGQDAYPCTTLIWLAKWKNSDSLQFKKKKKKCIINLWITGFILEMAVQLGTAARNSNDDGKCACIMYQNLKSYVLQTPPESFCKSSSFA